ncbi:MAG: hypothetical protein KC684_00940 [Candidatus Omnitrophica bacterium]|nr:hypothetical protein [Candidatus Omnitrophota bacterium]
MDGYFYNRRKSLIFKVLCSILVVSFFTLSVVPPGYAQMVPMPLNLPAPGAVLPVSPGYVPTLVKGLAINPQNPLEFDFFVDPGDSGMKGEEFKTEANKLIKYFLASLTIAEEDLWVNLSPYEEGRIIPDTFGQTEMGRDLLAQDYILKQLTASMMYPENELGQKFWNKVYDEAQAKFGTREIPMSTFNKIWIVPERATIYINGNNVFVADTHLKVLLEEDYVALRKDTTIPGKANESLTDDDMEEISETSSAVIREVLLPAIEKEINEGQNFANLRQINNSLTLAVWYKKNLKESLLGQVYADQGKVKGIEQDDVRANREIYNRYVEAFKTGVYDYIKEEYDPSTQSLVSRKYFSGGFGLNLTQTTPAGTVRELSYADRINEIHKDVSADINTYSSIDIRKVENLASTTKDLSRFQVVLEAPRSTPQDRAMITNEGESAEDFFKRLKESNLSDQELLYIEKKFYENNLNSVQKGETAFAVLKNLSDSLAQEYGTSIHDDVIETMRNSGFEVKPIKVKMISKEEAADWYKQHEGRKDKQGEDLLSNLIKNNTRGPVTLLLISKKGSQGDSLYKLMKDEIQPKIRSDYNRGQYDYDNILHVPDDVSSASREFEVLAQPRDNAMFVDVSTLKQFRKNILDHISAGLFNDTQLEALLILKEIGEWKLTDNWDPMGVNDDKKKDFLDQVLKLDKSYPGGLIQYKANGKKKLKIAEQKKNPLEGVVGLKQAATDDLLDFTDEKFQKASEVGLLNAINMVAALPAGGTGDRLGYQSGIKLSVPLDLVTMKPYIQQYIETLKDIEVRSNRLNQQNNADHKYQKIPFTIMTSDATHSGTIDYLEKNDYFGMEGLSVIDVTQDRVVVNESGELRITSIDGKTDKGPLNQIVIFKQESVVAMKGYDADFLLNEDDQYKIETKPHNHGDIHLLMKLSGLAEAYKKQGKKHTLFFQDTNGEVVNAILPGLGQTIIRGHKVNFLTVKRRPGDKVGAIGQLEYEDGTTRTGNIEYNLLDDVEKSVNQTTGDEADANGYSKYPGNLNVYILEQDSYVDVLEKTGGVVGEIVNPKEDTLISRLEAPMQDISLEYDGKDVGVTSFDARFIFDATKNGVEKALAAVRNGNFSEFIATTEGIRWQNNRRILKAAGVDIDVEGKERFVFGEIPYNDGAKIDLRRGLFFSPQELRVKFNNVSISDKSVISINSEDFYLNNVAIDGTLIVNMVEGASLVIENIDIKNEGWEYVNLTSADLSNTATPEYLTMRGYRLVKNGQQEINITEPGEYRISAETNGKVVKIGESGVDDNAMIVNNNSAPDVILNSTSRDFRDSIQAGNILIEHLQAVIKGEVSAKRSLIPLWTSLRYGKTVSLEEFDPVYNRIDVMLEAISEELDKNGIMNESYFETVGDSKDVKEIGLLLQGTSNDAKEVVVTLSKIIRKLQENNDVFRRQIALGEKKEDKAMFSDIDEIIRLHDSIVSGENAQSLFREIEYVDRFVILVENNIGKGFDSHRDLVVDVENYMRERLDIIRNRGKQRPEYVFKADLELYFRNILARVPDGKSVLNKHLNNTDRLIETVNTNKANNLKRISLQLSLLGIEIHDREQSRMKSENQSSLSQSKRDLDTLQDIYNLRDDILENAEVTYQAIEKMDDFHKLVKDFFVETHSHEQYKNATDSVIQKVTSMQETLVEQMKKESVPIKDMDVAYSSLQLDREEMKNLQQRSNADSMLQTMRLIEKYANQVKDEEEEGLDRVHKEIIGVQLVMDGIFDFPEFGEDQAMLVENKERFDHYAKAYKTVLKNLTNALNEQVSGNAQKIKLWGAEDYDDINIAAAYAIEGSSTDEAFNAVNNVILDVMRDLSAKVNKDPEHRWTDPRSFESKMNYNPGEFYFDIKEDGRNIKEMGIQFYNSDAKDILKVLGATRDDLAKGIQELEKPFEESTAYSVYGSIVDQYNEIKKYYDSNTMDVNDEFLELNNIRLSGLSEMLRYLFHSFGHKAFIEENVFEKNIGDIEALQYQTAEVLIRRAQTQPKKDKDSQDQAMLIGDGYYQNREVYIEAYRNVLESLTKALSDKNKMLMDREVILWRAEDFKNNKIPMAESMFPDTDDQMYNFMLEISSELMSEVMDILESDNSNVNINHIFVPGDEEGQGESYVQSMGVSVGNADIIDFIRAFEKAKVIMENTLKNNFNPDSKSDRAMLIQDVNVNLEEIYTALDAIALDYKNGKVNKNNIEYYIEELSDQRRQMLDLFVNLKVQDQADKINEGLVKNAYRLNKSLTESFTDINNTVDISLENLSLEAIYDAINDISLALENGEINKDNLSDYKETLRRLQNRMIDYSENLIVNRDNTSQADVILIKNAHQVGKALADKLNQFNDKAVGGIDLNPASLNLEIRRDSNGIPLPVSQQPLQQINVEGFVPVIINVTPVSNFPLLLGLTDTEDDSNIGYDSPDAYDRKVSVYDRKLQSQI